MASSTEISQNLKHIAPNLFKESPVLFAYLFGSHAKQMSHPSSDLDIAVYVEGLEGKACLDLELSLSLKIDELLNHRIDSDVRVLNHLPLTVKGNILSHGKLIYTRDENKRTQFETQVRLAYFDFLPVIQQYQDSFRAKALSDR
jgi:uncharacterized protein